MLLLLEGSAQLLFYLYNRSLVHELLCRLVRILVQAVGRNIVLSFLSLLSSHVFTHVEDMAKDNSLMDF